MKIRNGFVSNSSSSSFIIAIDEKDCDAELKLKLTIPMEIKFSEHGEVCRTEQELLKYYKNEYDDDLECSTNMVAALKAIREGKTVIIGSFSDEGSDFEERALCETGLENVEFDTDVEVIQGEGGY